jgi:nucleoside-diphosphate-sugar epimerase
MATHSRRRVLLTGATGSWGRATLRELRRRDAVDVVAFAQRTAADRRVLREFRDMANLRVVWGDLTSYDDVSRAVVGVHGVLPVGAVVSPLADTHPELAWRVNVGSMRNLVRAVREVDERIEVVGVGSVAETGDRHEPYHWGRVGDPVRVSLFDAYGQTKVVAERLLVDSGLPRWAWLRQTGILHPGVLAVRDPIITHVPLDGVVEWVSDQDSARLLAGIAEGPPRELWHGIFNVGGGPGWRLTNWQFLAAVVAALGTDVRDWFERDWFALRNFHGHWFTDSGRLEELVPFRSHTFDEALRGALTAAPPWVRTAGWAPPRLVKHLVQRPMASRPRGTLHALRHGRDDAVMALFGSRADWERIGDWSTFTPPAPSRTPLLLHHGYDESRPPGRWNRADYAEAAAYRGGRLVDNGVRRGDVGTPLAWQCAFGHEFRASPRLVLTAGHWCPRCVRDPAGYARQAERNPFLAQVQ